MNFNFETILSILGLLGLGGIIGAYFNHFLERKREIERRIIERREEQYRNFLENLLAFFEGWHDIEKKRSFMIDLYTHAPLYASDGVIKLANEFLKSFRDKDLKQGGKSDIYYRKLVTTIRREIKKLNNEETSLQEDDFEVLQLNAQFDIEAESQIPEENIKQTIKENDQPVTKKTFDTFKEVEEKVLNEIQGKLGGVMKKQINFMYGMPDKHKPEFIYRPDATIQTEKELIFIEVKYVLKPEFAPKIVKNASQYLKTILEKFGPSAGKKLSAKLVLASDHNINLKSFKVPEGIDLEFYKL